MKILYSILSIILGADYEILRACPIDYRKQKRRIFLAMIISILTSYGSLFIFRENIALLFGTSVLFLHIFYISRYEYATFPKILITLVVSVYLFYSLSFPIFGGIKRITNEIELFIAIAIGLANLIVCMMTINFSDENSEYIKLINQKDKYASVRGDFLLLERHRTEKEIIRKKQQEKVRIESELVEYTSNKIIEVQKKLIAQWLDKWFLQTEQECRNDFRKYLDSTNIQFNGVKKSSKEDLSKYISERLQEKHKEFVDIIIEKWADEKRQQVQDNPTQFIHK